jgi:hypothetical protein
VIFQTVWQMNPCRSGATVAIPQNIIATSTQQALYYKKEKEK